MGCEGFSMRFKRNEDSFSLGLHPKLKLNPNPNPSSFSPIFFLLLSPLPKEPNRARKPAARKQRSKTKTLPFLVQISGFGSDSLLFGFQESKMERRGRKWLGFAAGGVAQSFSFCFLQYSKRKMGLFVYIQQ